MKNTKRLVITILCMLLAVSAMLPAYAIDISPKDDVVYTAAEQQLASMISFDGSFEFVEFCPTKASDALMSVEADELVIPYAGMSSIILFDTLNYRDDGHVVSTRTGVQEDAVEYGSSDISVALAYDGRILATGIGSAEITVKYGEYVQRFNVRVEDEIPEELIRTIQSEKASANALSERSQICLRAIEMVYLNWTPTSNVRGWRNGTTFYAGTNYKGIPYTQAGNGQRDADGFLSAMSNSDFYSNFSQQNIQTGETIIMPRYGNDCSAFVAVCWQLPYDGNGRYWTGTFLSNYQSLGSYSALQEGDAVVNSGHMFLIADNFEETFAGAAFNEPYTVCYEQTPYVARSTYWTYAQLTAGGYRPISKF